jgi:predicted metal-dependent hydrolase
MATTDKKDTRTLKYLGQYKISLGGRTLVFNLRRSLRARLIWLKMGLDGELTVTIPRSYPTRLVRDHLKKNVAWISDNLEKCRRQQAAKPEPKGPVKSISFLGRRLELVRERCFAGFEGVTLRPDRLILKQKDLDSGSGDRVLAAWLREEAGRIISARSQDWAARIGARINRITIRDQRTRWASCSQKANLSFNWRLVMAPEAVLEYIIVHELCHLKEMNHSPRFWKWVARYCPDWREQRKWMDAHGRELRECLA